MLTVMTEDDWAIVMDVFDASQTRSGEPGHNDRKFLEAMHYFTVHNITWRALPAEVQIIRRCDQHRFVVLPKRWIVERTIGWISHHRRLARDFERHAQCATAFVRLAMIRIMMGRQARCSG